MPDSQIKTTENDIIIVQSKLTDYYDCNITYDAAQEAFDRLTKERGRFRSFIAKVSGRKDAIGKEAIKVLNG